MEVVLDLGPQTVAHSVGLRIGRLGPDAGKLAKTIAVLGDGAQLRPAAALAGLSVEDAAAAADRLAGAGLLEPGMPLRYVHALVRAAVYEDIPPVSRSLRHGAAAAVLAEQQADLDQVCAHLVRCQPSSSEDVVQRLRAGAGRALARGAPDVAGSYLERALAEGGDGRLSVALRRDLAHCETMMRTPGPERHLRAALEALVDDLLQMSRAQGSVFASALALAYRTATRARRGELAAAESDLRSVLDLGQQHELAFLIPPMLWYGIDVLVERPDLGDFVALLERLDLPPDLDRTAIGAVFREARGRLALAQGNVAGARASLGEAAETLGAMRLGNPNGSPWRSAYALALRSEDRAEARRLVLDELADARRLGHPRPIGVALRALGIVEAGAGGLDHLRESIEVLEGAYARLEHARALGSLGSALRRANQRLAAREPLRTGLDLAHGCGALRLAAEAREELLAAGCTAAAGQPLRRGGADRGRAPGH